MEFSWEIWKMAIQTMGLFPLLLRSETNIPLALLAYYFTGEIDWPPAFHHWSREDQ